MWAFVVDEDMPRSTARALESAHECQTGAPAFDARRNFGSLIEDVSANGDKIIVERHGKPVAVIVPVELYEQWKAIRGRFFEMVALAAENANLSPEEADALAAEAVAAVRNSR